MPAATELRDELVAVITHSLVDLRSESRLKGVEPTLREEETTARVAIREFMEQRTTSSLLSEFSVLTTEDESAVVKAAIDTVLGLGPLQKYLDDSEITDIHVRGSSSVWVKLRDGSRRECEPAFENNHDLVRAVRNLASRSRTGERRFDAASAECNLCLDDGSRLFAVMDVSQQPSLVIRKHRFELSSLDQLQTTGLFDSEVRSLLSALVRARRNIVVVGGTGSGKTTLLRALINEIPREERIITIEDAYEIGIDRFSDLHPDHEALQSRSANVEGHGALPLSDLTRMALRMDPDRVVIGEVRGAEAFPMLLAMSQGNNGSMCTLHADGTRSAFSKLAAYVSMANTGLPIEVVNLLIANSVHVVLHIDNNGGHRSISSIREVVDSDGSQIVSNELYSMNNGSLGRAFPMTNELHRLLHNHGFRS